MPDIKTALQTALKSQKSPTVEKKTSMHLVWLWLRDHPNLTAARVRADLRLVVNPTSVSSLLAQLEDRRMISSKQELKPPSYPKIGKAEIKVYAAVGKSYELLPTSGTKSKRGKKSVVRVQKAARLPATPPPLPPPPVPPPVAVAVEVAAAAFDVESLTVREARALHEKLKKLFGGSL